MVNSLITPLLNEVNDSLTEWVSLESCSLGLNISVVATVSRDSVLYPLVALINKSRTGVQTMSSRLTPSERRVNIEGIPVA